MLCVDPRDLSLGDRRHGLAASEGNYTGDIARLALAGFPGRRQLAYGTVAGILRWLLADEHLV